MKNKEVVVDDEFKQLIPPLTEDEYNKLKESIISDGCRDPLVLWDFVLLDGHNRYKICMDAGLLFTTVNKNFSTRDEAKIWILENQLGRRNLNDAQHIDITDKLFGLQEKKDAEQRMISGKKNPTANLREGNANNKHDGESTTKLATKAKVSPRQYQKGIKIKTKNKALWEKCLSGDMSIDKASKTVDAEEKQKIKEKKSSDGEGIEITDKDIDFRLGDFKEALKDVPDGSIDLIITDPPYGIDYLYLWDELSILAKRVLKKNGFCICYSGELNLPDVFKVMGNNLSYYWCFCLLLTGSSQLVTPRNVLCRWKPLLVYQNCLKKKIDSFTDFIEGSGRSKKSHEWEQSGDELRYIIDNFSKEGDTILDPMAGSGTTLIMSRKMKRKAIGTEIDKEYYNIANGRFKDELG
jgi:hypothetical protein